MIVVNELYKFQKILFVAWRGRGGILYKIWEKQLTVSKKLDQWYNQSMAEQ